MEQRGTGAAVISITGNRSVVVDGCDGIVDYDEKMVILRTGRLTVRLEGHGLRLKKLTENSAVIEGVIAKVEYAY